MRYLAFIFILALIAIPASASAQSAVIFVIDAMGSSYISPGTATYASTSAMIPAIDMKSFDRANEKFQLKVPVPATEFGHAVIVTGCSGASEPTVENYHSTIFDVLKDDGYLTLGIMDNGDTPEMIDELDAIAHNANESILSPDFEFTVNSHSIPADVENMMRDHTRALQQVKSKDPYQPYIVYNAWGIDYTRDLVDYMGQHHPGMNYVLIVNIGGLDSAGHNLGYSGYKAVLSGMDDDLGSLVDACERTDTLLMVTGDHGMSFKSPTAKGAHESADVAGRNESLLTPLFIYSNKSLPGGGTYGQECLAPTLLSLLDEPNTLSMCDSIPLPIKDNPTLFLRSESPMNVTVTGPGLNISTEFKGTYRLTGLEKGDYTIRYEGIWEDVRLDHDVVVDVRKDGQTAQALPPWIIYIPAAIFSVAGIAAALKLSGKGK